MGVDYYAVLDVERKADLHEIRKGYARTAIRCHPERPYPECPPDDLNLRANWFQLAGEAYEVLSNPFLRAAYDKFGEAGLKNGVPARDPELFSPPYTYHGDALKTYREFFGTESAAEPMLLSWQMHFEQRRPDGKMGPWFREKATTITLPLSLDNVMHGGQVEAVMMRRELNLNGNVEVKEHRFAIDLPPGTPCGSSFLFPKQGHQAPFSVPGDVLVVTKDLPHPIFSREKHDLVIYCRVNLTEALLGCSVQVPTLDGRLLRINITDVISCDYELRIVGEGMPICPLFAAPSPLEPPSRQCYLQVPGWVKESGADLPGKMGPCSTCGQTADCCGAGSDLSILPTIHQCSSNCVSSAASSRKASSDSDVGCTRRESRNFSVYGADGQIIRHASFANIEVENDRHQTFLKFPELFQEREPLNGDLVIRFQIDFPKDVPGNRRQGVQSALDGLVDVPERRVIFNKKY